MRAHKASFIVVAGGVVVGVCVGWTSAAPRSRGDRAEAARLGARYCCDQPDRRCPPDPALWTTTPVWQALRFSVDERDAWTYQFEAEGVDAQARFLVRAVGDPDCDGAYEVFEMLAGVQADGSVGGGMP